MRQRGLHTALSLLLVLAIAAALPGLAMASSLDDIINRGKVLVGVDLGVPPFGFYDENMEPAGYDVDVAKMIAEDLGVQLELVPLTGPNRIPYLHTGKVDMVVATFGVTPQRALSVAFSTPYLGLSLVVFGPEGLPITKAEDTAGYTIGITRGTTQDIDFTATAPEGVRIVRFDDDAATAAALLSGQVDAIATANLVAMEIAKRNPNRNFEIKYIIRLSPASIGVRRNEPDLLQWVNTFVFFHRENGDFDALHRKWLGQPLPDLPIL